MKVKNKIKDAKAKEHESLPWRDSQYIVIWFRMEKIWKHFSNLMFNGQEHLRFFSEHVAVISTMWRITKTHIFSVTFIPVFTIHDIMHVGN